MIQYQMLPSLLITCCIVGAPQSLDPQEKAFECRLSMAFLAKEPQDELESCLGDLEKLCHLYPDNPNICYLHLRALELQASTPLAHPRLDWRQEAVKSAARFPKSVRIATVVARADGFMTTAQKAHELDSTYGPACVVFAKALIKAGKPQEARRVMQGAKLLAHVSEGFLTLAQACYAANDFRAAQQAAEQQAKGRREPSVEPSGSALEEVRQAHALLTRIHEQMRHPKPKSQLRKLLNTR